MLKTKKTVYRVPLSGQPCGFNRIAAIDPGKKRQKKTILYGPGDRNGLHTCVGIELTAKAQGAHYREGLYPISNPRRIFGDISPNRYVFELL